MSARKPIQNRVLLGLQIAALGVLIGRAWQLVFQSNPILSLCYDERFVRPFIEGLLGMSWSEFQADTHLLASIEWGIAGIGFLFFSTAVAVSFSRKTPTLILRSLVFSSTFFLVFLAFAYYVDKGFALGQFIEYALQMSSPLLFYSFLKKYFSKQKFITILKFLISFTFIGHGLYAIGYYPQPGHFVQMMIDGFGLTESIAKQALIGFGVLDFVAVVLIFLPFGKWVKTGIYYTIIWGFLTTVARLYTNFYIDLAWDSLLEWLPDFLYRLPHFLIPLVLLILIDGKYLSSLHQKENS